MKSAKNNGSSSIPALYIIDGNAFLYRAYYAIRALSNSQGEPTNAIYGFLKMLAKLRTAAKPTHLAVIWDGGLASERTAVHPEY